MSIQYSLDLVEAHASLWERFEPMLKQQRLPHALLLIAPPHAALSQFVNRLMALWLCPQPLKPCGACSVCHWLQQGVHPDTCFIRQETPGSVLKIDQIRALQHDVYQTPQCGAHRFIIIEPANKLNESAANALLKILEEPPEHAFFILIAEHLSTLPATLISRCQRFSLHVPALEQSDEELDLLSDLIENKITICTLASQWSKESLLVKVQCLYQLTAQAIQMHVLSNSVSSSVRMRRFVGLTQATDLFKSLDLMNGLMQKLNQNITLNQTLALEVLLLSYLRIESGITSVSGSILKSKGLL